MDEPFSDAIQKLRNLTPYPAPPAFPGVEGWQEATQDWRASLKKSSFFESRERKAQKAKLRTLDQNMLRHLKALNEIADTYTQAVKDSSQKVKDHCARMSQSSRNVESAPDMEDLQNLNAEILEFRRKFRTRIDALDGACCALQQAGGENAPLRELSYMSEKLDSAKNAIGESGKFFETIVCISTQIHLAQLSARPPDYEHPVGNEQLPDNEHLPRYEPSVSGRANSSSTHRPESPNQRERTPGQPARAQSPTRSASASPTRGRSRDSRGIC
jgi:hypothetical protein